MEFFKQNKISCTENKELKIYDTVINGSNIVQLVGFLLRDRSQKPIAFDQFQELLNKISFPQEFIKNKDLKTGQKTIYARPEPCHRKRRYLSTQLYQYHQ